MARRFRRREVKKNKFLKSYISAHVPHSQNVHNHHHQKIQQLHLPPPPGLQPTGHPRRWQVLPREARRLGNGHAGEAHGTLPRLQPQPRDDEAVARVQLLGPRAGGGEDIGGAGSEVAGGDAGVLTELFLSELRWNH